MTIISYYYHNNYMVRQISFLAKLQKSVIEFQDYYQYLPGDYPNSYKEMTHNNQEENCVISEKDHFIKGNGNNLLDLNITNQENRKIIIYNEFLGLGTHLCQAGLINTKQYKLYQEATSNNTLLNGSEFIFKLKIKNNHINVLSVRDIYEIDKKYDDSMPLTGLVQISPISNLKCILAINENEVQKFVYNLNSIFTQCNIYLSLSNIR